jgi:hypothetical protein
MRVTPEELGADAYVAKAVTTAVRVRSEGFKVPLTVDVANGKLKRFPRRPREADRPGARRREPHAAQLRPRRASVGARAAG